LCTNQAPACCTEELRCVESIPTCRIEVLAETVGVVYEYADLEQEIAALSGMVEFTIPLTQVERAAADPPPASRFELTLSVEASSAYQGLTTAYTQPFRFSCDEQTLFVGVIYMLEGAAAIRTPMIDTEEDENGALVVRLGARIGAWGLPELVEESLRERIDRPELRAALCARGILGVLE